jgi:hypothetical protein
LTLIHTSTENRGYRTQQVYRTVCVSQGTPDPIRYIMYKLPSEKGPGSFMPDARIFLTFAKYVLLFHGKSPSVSGLTPPLFGGQREDEKFMQALGLSFSTR